MDTHEQELSNYLVQIKSATRAGHMSWSQANPTTYLWSPVPPVARVTLQKVARPTPPVVGGLLGHVPPPISYYYVLQALDLKNPAVPVTKAVINGSNVPALNEILGDLFDTVADRYNTDALDFLKLIVPK